MHSRAKLCTVNKNSCTLALCLAAPMSGCSTHCAYCLSVVTVFQVSCRFVKFQSLTCLSIFVANNQGDEDSTRIQKIAIFGQSGETMNVADIKKAGEEDKN